MKEALLRLLPRSTMRRLRQVTATHAYAFTSFSYSQEGEDLILERVFENQESGFYVDVGAHHPVRFSNTYRFYIRGWRGINVEPNADMLRLFQRRRKRDINLGYGVGQREGSLDYFMFNEPALNSFDRQFSEQRQSERYRIVEVRQVAVKPLSRILETFLPVNTRIDFMSVDAEGYDFEIVQSNDWTRFRPGCVLVEAVQFDLSNPRAAPMHRFLEEQRYTLFAKTFNTLFYRDSSVAPGGR